MKKTILYFIFIILGSNAFAQKILEAKDITPELSFFAGQDNEAGVTIVSPSTIKLTFTSSLDKTVDIIKTDREGENTVYQLKFLVGKKYYGRRLTIYADGYSSIDMELNLTPKELKKYSIIDPNIGIIGCYYQMTKEAAAFFQKALYREAKEKYEVSMQCSDFTPDNAAEIKTKIGVIDSILTLRALADASFNILDYKTAYETYLRVFGYNNDDQYVVNRMMESQQKINEYCNIYFNSAENYFKNGENEKALDLYKKLQAQSCRQSEEANLRILAIENRFKDKKQRATVLTYEYEKDTPIGFSIGKYKQNKSNGYFTLRVNSELFEALRQNNDSVKKPELNVSFGWTINIVKPLWIFFGPGYTAVGKYSLDKDAEPSDDEDYDYKDDLDLKICSAVSPEIGVLAKIGPVAIRYTFQYRFALKNEESDWIGKTRHIFGAGICF